ncbi:MAG: PaREP1 family protein [Thermofilum sp.]|nr:PaREP1 family protein [Thermofilum sp.]
MGAAEARERVELALRYLEEGKALVERDPVQASEKLYKAAEETVKALAVHLGLSDILEGVEKRGRWTATDLEKAVEAVAEKIGDWFSAAWDAVWTLHVWGFHEAKLDSKAVELRVRRVERMLVEARKLVGGEAPNARST